MSDSEKIALVYMIIADFWELNEKEDRNLGAIHVLNVISSIFGYTGKEK